MLRNPSAATRIVLASTSRYRKALVERLGIAIETVAPPFDERNAEQTFSGSFTEDLAAMLARGKAFSLAPTCPGALILGADQIPEIDGERLHKPETEERARAQLRKLSGRQHRLVTAVTLVRVSEAQAPLEPLCTEVGTLVDVHRLTMRSLSDAAIAHYVERDSPLDCAGSYRVESLGIALFERLEGNDFTAIVGIPLTAVVSLLAQAGVDVLSA